MPPQEYMQEGVPPEYFMNGGPPPGFRMGGGGPPQTFTQKIMAQAKEPAIVAVLFILLNNSTVQDMLGKYISLEDKPFMSILLRAGIAAALFFVVKMFLGGSGGSGGSGGGDRGMPPM